MSKIVGLMMLTLAVAFCAATTLSSGASAQYRQNRDPSHVSSGSQMQPIHVVIDHPMPASARQLSMDAIRRSIMVAGAQRRWSFEAGGPEELIATQEAHGWMVKVRITYSQNAYSINLVDTNLQRDGNDIDGKYNQWVRNLEKDIQISLTVDALRAN